MEGQLIEAVTRWLPLFFRCLGALLFLPLGEGVEHSLRLIALAALLALLLAVNIEPVAVVTPFSIITELLIGFLLQLPLSLLIHCGAMFGELFDSARGQTIARMYDPSTGSESTPFAFATQSYLWAVLLLVGSFDNLVVSLWQSADSFPPGAHLTHGFEGMAREICAILLPMLDRLLLVFLPLALLFFLVDFAAGLLGKVLPQLSLLGEAFQVKTYLGLFFLLAMLRFLPLSTF